MLQSMAEATYQQGIEQGIEQGEIRAKQEALLKLLHHRFPSVPDAVITRVRALDILVELDALFEKGLTAESLEEFPWQDPEA